MNIRVRRTLLILTLAIAGAMGFTTRGSAWPTQSPDSQEPSTGPKPDVGETVLVPKKSQPAPPPAESSQPAQPAQPENKPEKINPNEIFNLSTSTNLVNVDVMVVDNNGNPIPSLQKSNFQVFDDGVPQAVTNFGTGEAPMTICMLIEFSNRWWPYLILALRYSYDFLQVIHPKDWVAVVSYDLKPQILTDFTQDRSEVRGALDTLRIPGFSEYCLFDALAFVLDRMKDIHSRKAVVAVSSGQDSFSKLTYDQILKIVKASDTAIYPIGLTEYITVRSPRGDTIGTLQAENALRTIASYSGGQAFFPRFEQELPSDYQQIAQQLRTQYSLGFVPTNPSRDGKFHKLKIDLVDDQGNPLRIVNQKGKNVKYKIVSRDGYYAPKS